MQACAGIFIEGLIYSKRISAVNVEYSYEHQEYYLLNIPLRFRIATWQSIREINNNTVTAN